MNSLQKSMKKKSTVNKAGNYTKPTMRKAMFNRIKSGSKGGKPGQWSARKAQLLASSYKKEDKKIVAVIGDGGLSAGMAFEALNHMGSIDEDILIILNDNEMSISPNVGAMTNYLTKIISSKAYSTVKEGSKNILKKVPPSGIFLTKTEKHIKGLLAPGMLFEEMGINYYGPIDGHDTHFLVKTLKNLKKIRGLQKSYQRVINRYEDRKNHVI